MRIKINYFTKLEIILIFAVLALCAYVWFDLDFIISELRFSWPILFHIIDAVENTSWLYLVLFVLCFGFSILYGLKKSKDDGLDKRILAVKILAFFYVALLCLKVNSHYCLLLLFVITLFLPDCIYKYKHKSKKTFTETDSYTETNSQLKGFLIDYINIDKHIDTGRGGYCEKLVEKLMYTDVSKEAFTVGIVGEWGGGKTSFIMQMEKLLDDQEPKPIIKHFNPWVYSSPEQMSANFFAMLKDILQDENINVESEINKYVQFLTGISTKFQFLSDIFRKREEYPQDAIVRIKNGFSRLDKRIFVMMDDLDRLQPNEILEILKIIRNSANFSNMIYIATYDKTYLANSISKEIPNAERYLEKIFQLEIQLPLCENIYPMQYMYYELKKLNEFYSYNQNTPQTSNDTEYSNLGKNNLIRELMRIVNSYPTISICSNEYIKNFRDSKRFLNRMLLIIEHIQNNKSAKNINIRDLFFLELIHFSDIETYKSLRDNPTSILKKSSDNTRYEYLSNDQKNSNKSQKILSLIFSKYKRKEKYSICQLAFYHVYFKFDILHDQIYRSEFLYFSWCENYEEIEKWVKELANRGYDKSHSLVFYLITEKIKPQNWMGCVVIAVSWLRYFENVKYYDIESVFSKVCDQICDYETINKGKKKVVEAFNRIRQSSFDDKYLRIATALKAMYPIEYINDYTGDTSIVPNSIFSTNEITEEANKNFTIFVNKESPDVATLVDEDSMLHKIINSSIVTQTCYDKNKEDDIELPIAFLVKECLLEYFRKTKETNNYKVLFDFFKHEEEDFISEIGGIAGLPIAKYFYNSEFYVKFLKECFNIEKRELENYLKSINLLENYNKLQ